MWVVVLYIPCVFLVSCFQITACLFNIRLTTCITRDFVYTASLVICYRGLLFRSYALVQRLVVLNTIFMFVFFNMFLIVPIFGLWQVKLHQYKSKRQQHKTPKNEKYSHPIQNKPKAKVPIHEKNLTRNYTAYIWNAQPIGQLHGI